MTTLELESLAINNFSNSSIDPRQSSSRFSIGIITLGALASLSCSLQDSSSEDALANISPHHESLEESPTYFPDSPRDNFFSLSTSSAESSLNEPLLEEASFEANTGIDYQRRLKFSHGFSEHIGQFTGTHRDFVVAAALYSELKRFPFFQTMIDSLAENNIHKVFRTFAELGFYISKGSEADESARLIPIQGGKYLSPSEPILRMLYTTSDPRDPLLKYHIINDSNMSNAGESSFGVSVLNYNSLGTILSITIASTPFSSAWQPVTASSIERGISFHEVTHSLLQQVYGLPPSDRKKHEEIALYAGMAASKAEITRNVSLFLLKFAIKEGSPQISTNADGTSCLVLKEGITQNELGYCQLLSDLRDLSSKNSFSIDDAISESITVRAAKQNQWEKLLRDTQKELDKGPGDVLAPELETQFYRDLNQIMEETSLEIAKLTRRLLTTIDPSELQIKAQSHFESLVQNLKSEGLQMRASLKVED